MGGTKVASSAHRITGKSAAQGSPEDEPLLLDELVEGFVPSLDEPLLLDEFVDPSSSPRLVLAFVALEVLVEGSPVLVEGSPVLVEAPVVEELATVVDCPLLDEPSVTSNWDGGTAQP